MDPNEEYERHENCADDLYLFLDDKQNAPSTPEDVTVWGDELKEIAKKFDVTALLDILDNATNALLESSNIPTTYRTIKSKLAADIQKFMRDRKEIIFRRADNLGISIEDVDGPFIQAPFRIIYTKGNHDNKIYINGCLVERYPKEHGNDQWNTLLTEFIKNKELDFDDIEELLGLELQMKAIRTAISRLRTILKHNNQVRNDGLVVSISRCHRGRYTLEVTEKL